MCSDTGVEHRHSGPKARRRASVDEGDSPPPSFGMVPSMTLVDGPLGTIPVPFADLERYPARNGWRQKEVANFYGQSTQ
jgi:hypothetical protein